MLTEINGNIDATYPIITGELTGYLGPIGTVTASADNSVGTPHVIVTQTPTPDGLDIDFAFKEMGIPGLDLTVEQDLTEEQQQTARENIDAQETLTFDAAPTQGSQNPVTSGGVYNSVADINAKIPAAASAQNKLADKEYVDDSINRTSAFFRGNFATYADLMAVAWQTTDPDAANYVSNNDYAFVAADETHSGESWRYIYVLEEGGQDNGWAAQYRVNESPLTPEQLAALNSGITSQGVSQIETNRQGLASHVSNTSNPHQVTKAQVGLGNVDNTSDANKPISTAQQAALDAKQDAISSTASVNSDKTPYLYRRAGGGVTIGNRAYSKLIGATIANNQLVDPSKFIASGTVSGVTVTNNGDGSFTLGISSELTSAVAIPLTPNGAAYYTKVPVGHKFAILDTGKLPPNAYYRNGYNGINIGVNTIKEQGSSSNGNIFIDLRLVSGTPAGTYTIKPNISDLTADIGSTIADYAHTLETGEAGAGVAWLKSYGFFGKYAPYDAGSLISTKAEGKKVTGKNILPDSEYATNPSGATNHYLTQLALPKVGETITASGTSSSGTVLNTSNCAINFKKNGVNLFSICPTQTKVVPAEIIETDAIEIYTNSAVANNALKLQLEYGLTATTYEKYVSQEYDLGSDELQGLFKLDANNNIVAEGDTKVSSGLITRTYTRIDLGAQNWIYDSSYPRFYTTDLTSVIKAAANNDSIANIICAKYISISLNALLGNLDKAICVSATSGVSIKDTAYTDAATFKAALNGVYLVAELATPTTEQGTPYQDPQEVFADGTEEYIDSRTVPVPVGHETNYPGITYLVSKLGSETAFSPFASDVPPAPTSDGTYVLQVSVSSGTPFFRWVTAAELVGE